MAIVTAKDPEGLEILRHSTAHLLAQAVQSIYPDAQVTIGPVIEDGFYYDFACKRPFTPEDLEKFEARMKELAAADLPVERRVMPRDEAVETFKRMGEHYKAEIIAAIPAGEDISLYGQGDWFDLCRGPHVPSTGKLGAFKLMKVAGAYWRGDSRNEMLQRIYGTAWPDEKQLKAYLTRLEEAEKRDHRRIGKELDLFHFQEEAPGAVFWHPKGWALFQALIRYMREKQNAAGFEEVSGPEIMDRSLWAASGHLETFGENMYTTKTPDERVYAIKPMNCPGHVQIFKHGLRSYRDLPVRLAEFGKVHRYEPSGALHGLMRVRAFTQDDAHMFMTEDQVTEESVHAIGLLMSIYRDFGFEDVQVKFADRPERRVGSDEVWDRAEAALQAAAKAAGIECAYNPGEGAFYGPKLEFVLKDAIGPRLAVRDAAGRLQPAGPTGRLLHRRGEPEAHPGDAPPGHLWLPGALYRHPDRASRRTAADLAGPCAGGGSEHHRRAGGVRWPRRRFPEKSGVSGRNRFAKRESRL